MVLSEWMGALEVENWALRRILIREAPDADAAGRLDGNSSLGRSARPQYQRKRYTLDQFLPLTALSGWRLTSARPSGFVPAGNISAGQGSTLFINTYRPP